MIERASVEALAFAGPDLLRHVLADVATGARSKWLKLAGERLHSSAVEYAAGIQEVQLAEGAAVIELVGRLPNMVEHGASAFDMHEGLLGDDASFWIEAKDGGRFRVIPFRHKTPGATQTGGSPMGFAFSEPGEGSRRVRPPGGSDPEAIGKAVYKKAQRLKPHQRLPAGLVPKLKPIHATDVYAGMKKNLQKIAGGKTQSTYVTFRTIAVDAAGRPSPEGKWRHPGIEARHLGDEVADYVEKVLPAAIEQAFWAALRGGS